MKTKQSKKICQVCEKEFYVKPYRKNVAKFCSHKCYAISLLDVESKRKTGRYIGCKYCNKKFWVQPNEEKINRKYCSTYCYHKNNKGKNNPNWKDNKATGIVEQIRSCLEYKAWRLSVFERDNFICQMPECDKIERILNTHHITIFSQILQDNNIKTIEQALECKELWDINNGITLCRKCHQNIIKKESQYENLFKEIVKLKQYGK